MCRFNGKSLKFDKINGSLRKEGEFSVIVPTYNESENIKNLIEEIRKNIKKTKFSNSYEIVIVDDNSKDGTSEIIDSLSKNKDVVALHRYGMKGLFSAVGDGIKISSGKYVLTMDADFSHPPELIPKFIKNSDENDIVYGSRYVKGGGIKRVALTRKICSKILNVLCIFIAGLNVSDFGGQFRLFRKESYEKITYEYPSNFAEYGIELFYRAKKLGLKMKAIPFTYEFREKGKSKMGNLKNLFILGKDYLLMALRLRLE